jgi:NAD(P)-dependent dehydrogenase (short-subunit alcohol dehydrogenase family)
MSKEAVSAGYTAQQLALHGSKTLRPLTDRRALVVGSDHHHNIGDAIARTLASYGMKVHAPERDALDLRNVEQFEAFLRHGDPIDTLILSNGYTHLDWIEDMPIEKTYTVVGDSLVASITATSTFARVTMNDEHRKVLVFIGSMAYRSVLNGSAAYCAAKAGLAHFAKCVAWELSPKGFDVFCVNPGNTVDTPMAEKTIQDLMRYRHLSRGAAEAYWGAVNPRGAWLTTDAIADLVGKLVSGSITPHLTGANLDLGGGVR